MVPKEAAWCWVGLGWPLRGPRVALGLDGAKPFVSRGVGKKGGGGYPMGTVVQTGEIPDRKTLTADLRGWTRTRTKITSLGRLLFRTVRIGRWNVAYCLPVAAGCIRRQPERRRRYGQDRSRMACSRTSQRPRNAIGVKAGGRLGQQAGVKLGQTKGFGSWRRSGFEGRMASHLVENEVTHHRGDGEL